MDPKKENPNCRMPLCTCVSGICRVMMMYVTEKANFFFHLEQAKEHVPGRVS